MSTSDRNELTPVYYRAHVDACNATATGVDRNCDHSCDESWLMWTPLPGWSHHPDCNYYVNGNH